MTAARRFLKALAERSSLVSLAIAGTTALALWVAVMARPSPELALSALLSAEAVGAAGGLLASLLAYQLAVLLASRPFLTAACGLFVAGSLWLAGLVTRPLPDVLLSGGPQANSFFYLIAGGIGLLPLAVSIAGRPSQLVRRSIAAAFALAAALAISLGAVILLLGDNLPPLVDASGFTANHKVLWSAAAALIAIVAQTEESD